MKGQKEKQSEYSSSQGQTCGIHPGNNNICLIEVHMYSILPTTKYLPKCISFSYHKGPTGGLVEHTAMPLRT